MTTFLASQSPGETERTTQVTWNVEEQDLGTADAAVYFTQWAYFPKEDPQEERITGETLVAKLAAGQRITEARLQPWGEIPDPVEKQLQHIASLPAGWDDRGISAVTPWTLSRTRCLLNLAYTWGKEDLPALFMSPANDGRIVLEWQNANGKELIVEVPSTHDEAIRFLLVEPTQTGDELEIESEFNDKWSTQTIVSRLLAKPQTANT